MGFFSSNSSGVPSVNHSLSCHFLSKECPGMLFVTYAWVAVEIFTVLVGIPSSLYVLWVFVRDRHLGCVSKLLVFHCTACDLLYCASLSLELANLIPPPKDSLTRISFFFHGLNLFGRPLFLWGVCVDRYLAVVHPHLYRRFRTDRWAVRGALGGMWVAALALCACLSVLPFRRMPQCVALFMVALLVAVVMFNGSLLRVLQRRGPGAERVHPVKRAAFRTASGTLLRLVFFYMPITSVSLVFAIAHTDYCSDFGPMSCLLVPASFSMTSLSSALGPIYTLHSVKKLPCAATCHNHSSQQGHS